MRKVYLDDEGSIVCEEAPIPEPKSGEVLIKTKYAGICGTDINAFKGETVFGRIYPFHIGHEIIGVVEQKGDDCESVLVGDHVVLDPLFTCGTCWFCRNGLSNHCINKSSVGLRGPGGFSDYVLAPAGSVFKISKDVDLPAASLAEPLSTVVNGVGKFSPVHGGHLLIIGFGAIGKMHFEVASLALGAAYVSVLELSPAKREDAAAFGASYVFDPSAQDLLQRMKDAAPYGFDMIIDCTGASRSVEAAITYLKPGGQLLVFGVCAISERIAVSPFDIYKKEQRIMGSYSATKKSMQEAIGLLESGKLRTHKLITHIDGRDKLEEILIALSKGEAKPEYSGKVIIAT